MEDDPFGAIFGHKRGGAQPARPAGATPKDSVQVRAKALVRAATEELAALLTDNPGRKVSEAERLLEELGSQRGLLVVPGATETQINWALGFFMVQDVSAEELFGIIWVGAVPESVQVRLFCYEPA